MLGLGQRERVAAYLAAAGAELMIAHAVPVSFGAALDSCPRSPNHGDCGLRPVRKRPCSRPSDWSCREPLARPVERNDVSDTRTVAV